MAEEKKQDRNIDKNQEKKQDNIIKKFSEHPLFVEILVILFLIILTVGFLVWTNIHSRIYIEKAYVTAPIITISTPTPGVLHKIYVTAGEAVGNHKAVALVGENKLYTDTGGKVISILDVPGQIVTAQDKLVEMIDPSKFRIIGQIDEDKGLSDIRIGQKVIFTVDAFGSKKYEGTVSEIAISARQQDIVFSISDKRQIMQYDISVKYNVDKYPELLNGMSAKMWIYK
jgi:multidrug resistance efflux pump